MHDRINQTMRLERYWDPEKKEPIQAPKECVYRTGRCIWCGRKE